MLITIDINARQIASLLRQTAPAKPADKPATAPKPKRAAKRKARPMTEHRRNYQKLLMRKRRAAAKAG
jgi:hypothetical protein